MNYETLLSEAEKNAIDVYERKMNSSIKGLYGDRVIWINKNQSSTEKYCTLSEELGHHYTTSGHILNLKTITNIKQEKRARNWGYKKLVPLKKIVQAHKTGIKNRYELAEFLNVTEKFLDEAIQRYKEEFGLFKNVDGLTVCFEPLSVVEFFEIF
ncbi:MAG: ImmA/IrrE family metallo-endopeptidase [Bacillus sp. (in: Bacteria)]|nr:ImmA/IrrE family metallo-endopeptidase [Bacillus sp. (in: firmicutes)]